MTPETRPLQGIVDFDGTIGGLSKEKYLEKFGWGFCVLTQLPINVYNQHRPAVEKLYREKLKKYPQQCGWIFNGFNTAPGGADLILFNQGVAVEFLSYLNAHPDVSATTLILPKLNDQEQVQKFLQHLHALSYNTDDIGLFPDSENALHKIGDLCHINIVTNSGTKNVQSVLQREAPDLLKRVSIEGGARKFLIDPNFTGVKKYLKLNGSRRNTLLRRYSYFQVIERIREKGRISFVAGDIFEMDLAIFEALRKQFPNYQDVQRFLMQTDFTKEFDPAAEEFFRTGKEEGRFLVASLSEIPGKLILPS